MIYTGNKALQYLSVPVYTIFKNLTIIVIAYGEVLWFGTGVSPLTLVSFAMMVFSSVIAAWADAKSASTAAAVATLNAGYAWMGINVFCAALYALGMRKVIKKTGFNNWEGMLCAETGLHAWTAANNVGRTSHVLQQSSHHPRADPLVASC